VSQNDPTDHALAAIASILDDKTEGQQPPPLPREAASPTTDEKPATEEKPVVDEKPLAPEQIEADGYFKVGPGPIASLRFKWTARRAEDGSFYVDETIGNGSAPLTNGPMNREAAIKFVDDRADEARQRFENLKNEMSGRSAVANQVRNDNSDA
jgi:hypothetical protein